MQERVQSILEELRAYCLTKGARADLLWQAEKSHFIRLANSAVSLNTSETLHRLYINVYGDHKKASTSLITDPANLTQMKAMIDEALNMLDVAGTLSYQPSVTTPADVTDLRSYDEELAAMKGEEILSFINKATDGLETDDIMLSGNFSTGASEVALISTESAAFSYWAATDAQITLVLSSLKDKWEINAEQSAFRKSDLNAQRLHERLAFLRGAYLEFPAVKLPLASYRVVLGAAALAEYLLMLYYFGFEAEAVMRDMGLHRAEDIGKTFFSEKFTLRDDARELETFPFSTDFYGRRRLSKPFYEKGVLRNFSVRQETADEFSILPNAADVFHLSLCLDGGEKDVSSFEDLREAAKEKDILYIPYLHYTGMVNPSEGLITGSSRFGALLFRRDGSVEIPYNVRITQRFADLFGERLLWLSREREAYNISQTYDARNPQAILLPRFCAIDDVPLAHSNDSY